MRSRLEARWASMFDALQWHWDYEPDLQAGFVIPDFLLSFAHPVLIECKPAVTLDEIADFRRALLGKLHEWLSVDVLREIAELDEDPESPLELTDQAIDDLARIARGQNARGRTRRALVVGPCLHKVQGIVTIDGDHGFCICCDHGVPTHIGLVTALQTPCLVCGKDATAWAAPDTMFDAWRASQNVAQWRPV